jgi:hypothetical protein
VVKITLHFIQQVLLCISAILKIKIFVSFKTINHFFFTLKSYTIFAVRNVFLNIIYWLSSVFKQMLRCFQDPGCYCNPPYVNS